MTLVVDLLLITVAALLGGLLARRLKLPLFLGYLVAGMVVGPYTGGVTVSELLHIEVLGEIGLVLLIFTFGIEFSLETLRPVWRRVLSSSVGYTLLSLLLGWGLGMLFGWGQRASLWFGMLLSLSSVALFAILMPRIQRAESTANRLLTGLVVAQNLLILPLFLIITTLHESPVLSFRVALAAIEGVLFVALLLALGVWLVPRLATYTRASPDLHALLTIAIGALLAAGTYAYGLPIALAAFPIGLALSEKEVLQGPLNEILQVRSLFGVLFFVSAGMLVDPAFIATHLLQLALLVLLVLLFKGGLLTLLMRTLGYSLPTALGIGLTLFQIGELSLVLARIGLHEGLYDDNLYSLMVALSLVTIVLTPFVLKLAARLTHRLRIAQPS